MSTSKNQETMAPKYSVCQLTECYKLFTRCWEPHMMICSALRGKSAKNNGHRAEWDFVKKMQHVKGEKWAGDQTLQIMKAEVGVERRSQRRTKKRGHARYGRWGQRESSSSVVCATTGKENWFHQKRLPAFCATDNHSFFEWESLRFALTYNMMWMGGVCVVCLKG